MTAREYSSTAEMLKSYATVRQRLYGKPVQEVREPVRFFAKVTKKPQPALAPLPIRDPPIDDSKSIPFMREIFYAVSAVHKVPIEDLLSKRSRRKYSHYRFVFFVLARDLTKNSYPGIGRFCGGRDHSAVHYGCEVVDDRWSFFLPKINAVLAYLGYPPAPASGSLNARTRQVRRKKLSLE
jgi:hypothetical protein